MIPLYDESAPAIKPPYVTLALIAINTAIFLFAFFSTNLDNVINKYGVIPGLILEGKNLATLITAFFLHGAFLHLIGNMWFLWLFGDNLEYNLGPIRFLAFYLLVGVIASLIHVFTAPTIHLNIPMVGASGAISGLLGGYLVLFPRNKIRAFFLILFYPLFFSIPAFIYIVLWFIGQLSYVGAPTSIAYTAHIGGFITGIILTFLFKRKIKRKNFLALNNP